MSARVRQFAVFVTNVVNTQEFSLVANAQQSMHKKLNAVARI